MFKLLISGPTVKQPKDIYFNTIKSYKQASVYLHFRIFSIFASEELLKAAIYQNSSQ